MARLFIVLTALLLAVPQVGCARTSASDGGTATVVEAIDGDTLIVSVGGHDETVRLLGVDTPETKHPTKPVECFGAEASAFTADALAPGTEIRLERDTEPRDQYGRLLAYVHRVDDGTFVNLALVQQGYADVLIIEPNRAYASALREAVTTAKDQSLGLWGACGGADTALEDAWIGSRATITTESAGHTS